MRHALKQFDISLPVSLAPSHGEAFGLTDPSTGLNYGQLNAATAEDVDEAVRTAHSAMKSSQWRNIPPADRERLIHAFADEIEKDADYLAALESVNTGRSIAITRSVDVPAAVSWLRQMAGAPSRIGGRITTPYTQGTGSFHAYTRRESVGVVAAIVPWNFPLVLTMWKIAPALAAGCAIVIKPAPETPLAALHLVILAKRAGVPDGLISTVCGAGETGSYLVQHPLVRKVAFTGSGLTGEKIVEMATPQMKRVTLELGGKSPSVIMQDADLETAIPDAALACFFNSGQVCYAGTRLYVQRAVLERVAEGITSIANSLPLGPSWKQESVLGPLISARQRDRVAGFVDRAKAQGGNILVQAKSIPEDGFYYPPTVFDHPHQSSEIVQEEVFGPVLTLTAFDEVDEVISLANGTKYGLAANLYTKDLSTAHYMASEIRAGSVFVNCSLLADPTLPFGGFGLSGVGRENGTEVFSHYLEDKSVIMKLSD
jgi:acyl-CoA reductase-like NAD-dependent aldehyde dehydrogenase